MIRPDGQEGIYGVVEMRPSVGIVAVSNADEVALVTQWRYTLDRMSTEIPTGGTEPSDRDLLAAARRELREETGLSARRWRELGFIDNSNGVSTDDAHMFLATGLKREQTPRTPRNRSCSAGCRSIRRWRKCSTARLPSR